MIDDDDDILSPTESDPVSDVNPDEMAQIMADLDDMDNSLFKAEKKGSASENVSPDEKISKRVSFEKNVKSSKGEDDWDTADDLLNSDDENQPKEKKKVSKATLNTGSEKTELDLQKDSELELKNGFDSDSNKEFATKSSLRASPKVNKNKLLADLFDAPKSDDKTNDSPNKATPEKTKQKNRSDVNFDDDTDPLNMDSKSKRTDPDFLDSLLGESSVLRPKNTSTQFVLPDKYKIPDVNKSPGLRANSPARKNGRSDASDPIDDLFGDVGSRPRRRTSAQRTNKTLEIKDDDILGAKSSKSPFQDAGNDKSKESKKTSRQEDWLLGSPKGTPLKMKEEMNSNPVAAIVEGGGTSPSASQKDNWLNQLLMSGKSSPVQKPEKSQAEGSATKSPEMEARPAKDHLSPGYSPAKQGPGAITPPSSLSEMEAQLLQQFQLKMQEQQQRIAQMMLQQMHITLPSFPTPNVQPMVEDNESIKQLKIDLHKAQTEAGRLQVELSLLREQHEKELEILKESQKKREILNEEVWRRKEDSVTQERDFLIERYDTAIQDMQKGGSKGQRSAKCPPHRKKGGHNQEPRDGRSSDGAFKEKLDVVGREKDGPRKTVPELASRKEKVSLTASYEAKLSQVQAEMADTLQRSKEMYASIVDRMKREHHNAVERLTELKDIELKATLTAAGHVKEVEHVVSQLEANTADISRIKMAVSERHESALELVRKSLQMKEKQLKDMEANLEILKAEAESERNRLTVLVNRLESSLANQGTEVESQKWAVAQEKMKLDVDRTSLIEEKRHFHVTMENERKQLAYSKESILREQREMMQTIARQKAQIYDMDHRQKKSSTTFSAEVEILQLKEEKKLLEEKISILRIQQEEMIDEDKNLQEKRLKLDEDFAKNATLKEMIAQKDSDLEARSRDLDIKEEKLGEARKSLQKKLFEITQATQNLHFQQDAQSKERARLEMEQEEWMKRMSRGLCISCSLNLRSKPSILPVSFGRIPGDGSEMHKGRTPNEQLQKSFDPASVLSRLKAAREEENRIRQKKLDLQSAIGRKLT